MSKTIEELTKKYKSIFYLEDDSVIPLVAAVVLSNRMPGDPIWCMLVGGSSSGKSEVLNCIMGIPFVHQVSTLTPNTLLSGASVKGKEASLLLRIARTSIIVMKDFTTILSMTKEDRQSIMAQFREVYDGLLTKPTGRGEDLMWQGKITLIAGVTEKIHAMDGQDSSMGLRTMSYSLPEQDRRKTTKRAAQIAGHIKEYREELKKDFKEYIDTMIPFVGEMKDDIPEAISDKIVTVSDFAASARSPVEKTWKGDVGLVLAPEMPMRISNQLHLLARVFIAMSGGVMPPQYEKILYKIALDSIPKGRRMALKELAHYASVTTKGVATKLGYPTGSVKPWLEEINALGMCFREIKGGSQGDKWILKDEFREIMHIFDHVDKVEHDLVDEDVAQGDEETEKAFGEFDKVNVDEAMASDEYKDLC
jgi:hypothetical protein